MILINKSDFYSSILFLKSNSTFNVTNFDIRYWISALITTIIVVYLLVKNRGITLSKWLTILHLVLTITGISIILYPKNLLQIINLNNIIQLGVTLAFCSQLLLFINLFKTIKPNKES